MKELLKTLDERGYKYTVEDNMFVNIEDNLFLTVVTTGTTKEEIILSMGIGQIAQIISTSLDPKFLPLLRYLDIKGESCALIKINNNILRIPQVYLSIEDFTKIDMKQIIEIFREVKLQDGMTFEYNNKVYSYSLDDKKWLIDNPGDIRISIALSIFFDKMNMDVEPLIECHII